MTCSRLLIFLLIHLTFLVPSLSGQESSVVVTGKITGMDQVPIEGVNIQIKGSQRGTYSDSKGQFRIRVRTKNDPVLIFSILNYETVELKVSPDSGKEILVTMKPINLPIQEVEVTGEKTVHPETVAIDPRLTNNLSNAGGGAVEQLIKTLPGVSSRNELSPQYSVRGGNYDENLLYVNGIEIFRPFLVKTGEQEGLSFVNPDLVSAIRFSSGGFESSYGDKMSSVLDIDYKTPDKRAGKAEIGALGASVQLEGRAVDRKFSYLTGIRYRDNSYLLGTLDQKGHYDPAFFDLQTSLGYDISSKFSINLLANVASNNYTFTPETRESRYGTLSQTYQLKIYFEGKEKDRFNNRFGALSMNFHPHKNLNLQLTASSFYSDEKERYDIPGQYYLNEILSSSATTGHPDSTLLLGVGSSQVHASNFLRASIMNIEHRGKYSIDNHRIQWGIKYQLERIHDQMNEWEMRDSAGYSLPYNGNTLELYYSVKSNNQLNSQRYSAFVEDHFRNDFRNSTLSVIYGARVQYWDYNRQAIFSPRISLIYLPDKSKQLKLHAAWGIYQQMPFFKELKDNFGQISTAVRAQKSIHYLVGMEYPFRWGDQPFKFNVEVYYKSSKNFIPYKINNLDLQYFPGQTAKGYATGLEMRLFGEPIPGATSWASITLMKTEEDIYGDHYTKAAAAGQPAQTVFPGYLPRPSDQRVNFSLFFQDYLPKNPNMKMNLTLLYGTGIPFGPPHGERWMDTFRMPSYSRVDLGFSRMLLGSSLQKSHLRRLTSLKEAWLSLEIFNLFDFNNTISYYWVSDFQNNMHAVPNYLTGRRLNLKMSVSF